MTIADRAADLGIRLPVDTVKAAHPAMRRHIVDLDAVNTRVMALAAAQSADIHARLEREGVRVLLGQGRLDGPGRVHVTPIDGDENPRSRWTRTSSSSPSVRHRASCRPRSGR
ncbi:hypothetical protein NKG05_23785 [Oerskovia sp. M15]